LEIFIDVDTHYFIRGQKAVFDALLEGVAVDGFAKIDNAGDIFGFFRRGG
jgi:hypothetical protein